MSKIEDYIKDSDNACDYANFLIDEIQQKAVEDIDYLFNETTDRDFTLWESMNVNPELTAKDYDQEDIDNRGLDWTLGLAGISAASTVQFFLDNREETLIKPLAYKIQQLDKYNLTLNELIQAGKRSFKVDYSEAYETIQKSILNQFDWMKQIDNSDLYRILLDSNALRPADKIIADSIGYVSRMTSYPPDSVQFKEALNELISSDTNRGLLGMNRRSVQQLYTERELAGDTNKLMVWVLEPGKNCSHCLDRAGQVRAYTEWLDLGLPGAQVCLGGDYCNCFLSSAT